MRKLGDGLADLVASLGARDSIAAEALRAAQVNALWAESVQAVFAEAARLVLDHTNTVYLMSGAQGTELRRFDRPRSEARTVIQGKVLAVYSDDSTVRAEIDARQELIKLEFCRRGEEIEALKIIPSTFEMKARHPFREEGGGPARGSEAYPAASRIAADRAPDAPARAASPAEGCAAPAEDPVCSEAAAATAAAVSDERVRRALQAAIAADLERKSSE